MKRKRDAQMPEKWFGLAELMPNFGGIISEQRKRQSQMLIEIKTNGFFEHEERTLRHHKVLYQGTYVAVRRWRTYITQMINLSAKQIFWFTRMEEGESE